MMSLFKKAKDGIVSGIGKAYDLAENSVLANLSRRHPDIDEVFNVMDCIKQQTLDLTDESEGDDKWRPMLLTLGILYKLQKVQTHWYYNQDLFVQDSDFEQKLLNICGYYWHQLVNVTKGLRNEGENSVQLLAEVLGLPIEDILMVHVADGETVEHHCPDFTVLRMNDHRQIVLVICGTRMMPAPNMKDVFMDLQADAEDFLHGKAHKGMAVGARNILNRCIDCLVEATNAHPDYGLLVTGYSLGAGIGHLVTMDLVEGECAPLLPETVDVRCITYGAPPVFVDAENESYKCQNIFSVICSNDGLVSASLLTVTKLLQQVKAIDRLMLRRRDMVRMLMNPINDVEGNPLRDSDDNDDDEDEGLDHRDVNLEAQDPWDKVRDAVDSVPTNFGGLVHLRHPCKELFVFRKRKTLVITRQFNDTKDLTDNLRLRGAMLNHHMPWSYDNLFAGFGETLDSVHIEDFDQVLPVPPR